MTPELLAALIELARVETAKVEHMSKYPEWWAMPDSCSGANTHLPASIEWTAICSAMSLNSIQLTDLAKKLAAEATVRCVIHDDCTACPALASACRSAA